MAITLGLRDKSSFYTRSFKNGLNIRWAKDNVMTLTTILIIMLNETPVIAIPNAVPEAGGCSVSVIVIKKIDNPTAKE